MPAIDTLPLPWEVIAVGAAAGAPVATELRTRYELLELGQPGDWDRKAVRARPLAINALKQSLRAAASAKADSNDRRSALALADLIGRNPEVWAELDPVRKELIAHVPESTASREWADLVIATWATTNTALEAVASIAPVGLVALLCATRRPGVALERAARTALEQRVRSGVVPPKWLPDTLRELGCEHDAPSWLTSLATATTSAAYETHTRAVTDSEPLLAEIVRSPTIYFRSADFEARLESVSLPTAVIGLVKAIDRVREVTGTAQVEARALYVAELRERAAEIERHRDTLAAWQSPALSDATQKLAAVATTAIRWATRLSSMTEAVRARATHNLPQGKPAETNLQRMLAALDFDARMSAADRDRRRRETQAALVWASKDWDASLEHFAPELPPEAYTLLWETGLGLRDPRFLRSVSRALDETPWAKASWGDLLCEILVDDATPPLMDDDVARRSIELLRERLARRLDSSEDLDPTGLIAQSRADLAEVESSARQALQHLKAVIDGAVEALNKGW